jgi:trk system potassium uptake protein TrkA
MRYIVIGLGKFGASLATRLTALGNEVIGVDFEMENVENIKDEITHGVRLNSVDAQALKSLPLEDADVIVVAIGEHFGNSLMTVALLRKMAPDKKIIARAMTDVHHSVIESMGVETIISPEREAAEHWALILSSKGIINSYELSDMHRIVEFNVPQRFIGKSVSEANLRDEHRLNIVTIKRQVEQRNLLGITKMQLEVIGVVTPDMPFEDGDTLVVFGHSADIRRFMKENEVG